MKLSRLMVAALLIVPLSASAQPRLNRQQKFPRQIPAGNYSGITPIGNDRYAVVSDKSADGFFVFHVDIDTLTGKIRGVQNEGFRASGEPNRDQESIVYVPTTNTLFISGEADNAVLEYSLDGQRTGRRLSVPSMLGKAGHNYGLESLTYDVGAALYYTMTERPLPGDSLLRLQSFNAALQPQHQYFYRLDDTQRDDKRKGVHMEGVSELLALGEGRLLVLERVVHVPRLKLGSYVETRLYEVCPSEPDVLLEKRLVAQFRTKLNLTRRNFANYEGMCVAVTLKNGHKILLLVADSQNQYGGLLRDWLKTIVL